jgi:hypothetical protein
MGEFGVEKTAAGSTHDGFPGKETRTNVVAMLDVTAGIIYGDAIPNRVEYRLKFTGFGAQPQIGGFQLLDFLLDFGVITDFRTLQTQEAIQG